MKRVKGLLLPGLMVALSLTSLARPAPAFAAPSTFGTISTSGAISDRFGVGSNFDALTYAADDVGYGPNLFYYLRHDS